jgi:hypothetical protein
MARAYQTIDEVIDAITEIVEWAKARHSRAGYFAALYKKVTINVKEAIRDGFFEDAARMERLDVLFACRYLDAFDKYRDDGTSTQSWKFAFEVSEQWWPIVLQHLLLGMNAHINLDLGVAAARTVAPEQLPDLHADFNKINEILARLVAGVQEELAQVWMPFRVLNRFLGSVDEAIIEFSMTRARDAAWQVAERLSELDEDAQTREIAQLDGETLALARLVRSPGIVPGAVTKVIRLGERGTVSKIIDVLA